MAIIVSVQLRTVLPGRVRQAPMSARQSVLRAGSPKTCERREGGRRAQSPEGSWAACKEPESSRGVVIVLFFLV
eukprot:10789009-Heterocapsa_arctica.AAC.1